MATTDNNLPLKYSGLADIVSEVQDYLAEPMGSPAWSCGTALVRALAKGAANIYGTAEYKAAFDRIKTLCSQPGEASGTIAIAILAEFGQPAPASSTTVSLGTIEEVLRRETSCIDPDDVATVLVAIALEAGLDVPADLEAEAQATLESHQ